MSFEPIYKSLGKFLPEEGFCNCGKNKRNQCELCQSLIKGSALEQLVRVTASPDPEELKCAYARIEELEAALQEARLQIEYLHEKFQPTGTSEAVLARLDAVLS